MTEKIGDKRRYQVIIIGGGPAGLSAGLWCDELGLDAVLLEAGDELGGQLLWTYNAIKNHLGSMAENGRELQRIFLKQLEERHFEIRTACPVMQIDARQKKIKLGDGTILTAAAALIFATGIRRRKLEVAGEEKFQRRGIIKSGKRDAGKVRGKTVAIVGGGDAAAENALILAEFAERVILLHRRREFRARAEFLEQIRTRSNIEILTDVTVTTLVGEDSLTAVELQENGRTFILPTDFLLLRIGVSPNTELLSGQVGLDERGYCRINAHCQTDIKDVYAIGDVANPAAPTVSGAVGMGATAAKSILEQVIQ
jgi:thioredoxin reductase (NADPH)